MTVVMVRSQIGSLRALPAALDAAEVAPVYELAR
jgi:hypothetical protein